MSKILYEYYTTGPMQLQEMRLQMSADAQSGWEVVTVLPYGTSGIEFIVVYKKEARR